MMTDYLLNVAEGIVLITEVSLEINYDINLEKLVDDGKYDFIHQNVFALKNNNKKGKKKQEILTVCFNRSTSSRVVVEEFKKMKVLPADLEDLVFYTSHYPEVQINYPVIALGSNFDYKKNRFVSQAGFDESCGRFLSMTWSGHRWNKEKRFLAVKH